jgi:SSS family solute:Na+ symporter
MAKDFLSPVAFTLFACGLFSAIMSTADSYLLAGTTLLTNNVILKIWPTYKEKNKIFVLRCVNLFLAIIAIFLAFSGQSIFNMMVHSGAILFVAIFIPVTAALFWKGSSSFAAWTSAILGIVSWLWYLFDGRRLTEDLFFGAAMFGALFSLAGYFIASVLRYLIQSYTNPKAIPDV